MIGQFMPAALPTIVPTSVVTPAGTVKLYQTSLLFTPEHGKVLTPDGVDDRLSQEIMVQGPVAVTVNGVAEHGSSAHWAKPVFAKEKSASTSRE
jgi:hypothetical protein